MNMRESNKNEDEEEIESPSPLLDIPNRRNSILRYVSEHRIIFLLISLLILIAVLYFSTFSKTSTVNQSLEPQYNDVTGERYLNDIVTSIFSRNEYNGKHLIQDFEYNTETKTIKVSILMLPVLSEDRKYLNVARNTLSVFKLYFQESDKYNGLEITWLDNERNIYGKTREVPYKKFKMNRSMYNKINFTYFKVDDLWKVSGIDA